MRVPPQELKLIWRYLDGVSIALASRFQSKKIPNEESLTFLLCELLDDNMTASHVLEYPHRKLKEDLADADGGFALDIAFETHEHSRHVESKFSGADLGLIFVIEHPRLPRSERAILLQAKRLFPKAERFDLHSSFNSFDASQRDFLTTIEHHFSAHRSIFYLWYAPSTTAFGSDDARAIRALEASAVYGSLEHWRWNRAIYEIARELGWRALALPEGPTDDHDLHRWRLAQPATRASSLGVVRDLTKNGNKPSLMALYEARAEYRRGFAFEPFADLLLLGLVSELGHDDPSWVRLARGEKIPLPSAVALGAPSGGGVEGMPEMVPGPKHSMTLTLRSSIRWPEGSDRS